MQGKIVKGIAGFYYVHVVESGIYECKAKGIFRKEKMKPLVGDEVRIDVLDEADKLGNIVEVLPRRNELIRPAVANVDQALIVFALKKPTPHLNLLDRFLVRMEKQDLPVILCFNKSDLTDSNQMEELRAIYSPCGYQLLFTSAFSEAGIASVRENMSGKTTVLAGPSGVGKSSLINLVQEEEQMETGALSEKIERGKHTTRHAQLLMAGKNSYIVDTPGFSSLDIQDVEAKELSLYMRDFQPYLGQCKFSGCVHIHEPECAIKTAVAQGKIHKKRYESYLALYRECENRKTKRY